MIALLAGFGVQLWLPETLGPVDLDDPSPPGRPDRARRPVATRDSTRPAPRHRSDASADPRQGRYLGGRPPYGYRLVDAGPHPTASHARWGRQQHRLDPDPATAPHVRWIFAGGSAGAA